ncbi:MAG TPA: S8 family serine peptidase [Albitalea sp.]
MATRKPSASSDTRPAMTGSAIDDMVLAAQVRGGESFETGRYVMTFKEGALDDAVKGMAAQGLRVADARDFENQAMAIEDVGDADSMVFPEVGAMVITGEAFQERGMSAQAEIAADSPVEAIEPEYFAFADGASEQYLQGFMRAAETIARDLGRYPPEPEEEELEAQVLGVTWGLARCKVPPSVRSGAGIRVAVLDTGMDIAHPDFAGRLVTAQSFVGQPVQDLHSHGTHCIGTACGPKAPPGTTPRYGIGFKTHIFVGKVLTNSGSGTTASVLAGMNWAIANRCAVISMSLGSQSPVQSAYTAAGQAALNRGCLIVAAAGNIGRATGAPANSPTIMAVASLDPTLAPSSFSNFGKIEIAAPGRDVFSSVPRPTRYGVKTGTSMATPHVAGCAALWAETSPALRGQALWSRLLATARPLPHPPARVGKGLVQAP